MNAAKVLNFGCARTPTLWLVPKPATIENALPRVNGQGAAGIVSKKSSKTKVESKKLYPGLDDDTSEGLGQVASVLDLIADSLTKPDAKLAIRLAEMFVTLAGLAESGDDVGFMVRKVWLLMHVSRTPHEAAGMVVYEFRHAAKSKLEPKEAARSALDSIANLVPTPEWHVQVAAPAVLTVSTQLVRELRSGDTKAQKMASDELWKLLGFPGDWDKARRDLQRKTIK